MSLDLRLKRLEAVMMAAAPEIHLVVVPIGEAEADADAIGDTGINGESSLIVIVGVDAAPR
jgi:hypothetical protein